ncbi:hypothetical protein HDU85_004330 [Gaertneriomyces sp. JEL0708]|nr:hypothetical protein HDU85_004330 [Gaertneriomyces sp. JEL0708]
MATKKATQPESMLTGDEVYALHYEEVHHRLGVDLEKTLTTDEARQRLAKYGENVLGMDGGVSMLKVFITNLINPMNIVLILAMVLSIVVKDYVQTAVIAVVVLTNTLIGFFQEFRSENAMAALKKLSAPTAKVIRDDKATMVPSPEVVPGDIVMIEEGDQVPADIRMIEAVGLEIDEMLLTGESLPVRKHVDSIFANDGEPVPVGDRKNLAFSSTIVTRGRGKGIVYSTGLNTEVGRIATLLNSDGANAFVEYDIDGNMSGMKRFRRKAANRIARMLGLKKSTKTPLQKSLHNMMYMLLFFCLILAVFVFWSSKWHITDLVGLYAVAVGVAIIPEGLPAVVTLTMALGVRTMAKQKALVRKLTSLEAVGMVTNICSDKTGTLTEGKMTAKECWIGGRSYAVTGTALDPTSGSVHNPDGKVITTEEVRADAMLRPFFSCASLCNESSLTPPEDPESDDPAKATWNAIGDPTEIALQVLAARVNFGKPVLLRGPTTFVAEMPFDPTLKRMTSIYATKSENGAYILDYYMKGALERVLECSVAHYDASGNIVQGLSHEFVASATRAMEALGDKGLRVLAIAHRAMDWESKDLPTFDFKERPTVETQMVFLGLVGIMDPPRETSAPSVKVCEQAGIEVHMATGDHAKTATAIAKQIGILKPGQDELVYTANKFDALSDAEIDALPRLPLVIARCSPETKVKLVAALHRRRKFVAMTGDGTNDAPALKNADIGIAMGLMGSDVAKEASDLVLTDDNFATIVAAIAQGRRIFENITKFTLNFLSGNVSEVIALIVGLAVRGSDDLAYFPMSAIQVLWLNMITSSPICLCLAGEPAPKDVMQRPPRGTVTKNDKHATTSVFTRAFLADVIFYGTVAGALSLSGFIISLATSPLGLHGYNAEVCASHSTFDDELCGAVYEARGVAFMTLNTILLVHGWNCRRAYESTLFGPESGIKHNMPLFWAIIGGFLLTLITILVPGLNTRVFQQKLFGWQWGLVVGFVVAFLAASEVFKLIKRRLYARSSAQGRIDSPISHEQIEVSQIRN